VGGEGQVGRAFLLAVFGLVRDEFDCAARAARSIVGSVNALRRRSAARRSLQY
jgi:hypothetical protein